MLGRAGMSNLNFKRGNFTVGGRHFTGTPPAPRNDASSGRGQRRPRPRPAALAAGSAAQKTGRRRDSDACREKEAASRACRPAGLRAESWSPVGEAALRVEDEIDAGAQRVGRPDLAVRRAEGRAQLRVLRRVADDDGQVGGVCGELRVIADAAVVVQIPRQRPVAVATRPRRGGGDARVRPRPGARRETLDFADEGQELAARTGTGPDTRIATTSPGPGSDSYWSLPWYLNDYKSVGYYSQLPSDGSQISVIIGNATQDAQLRTSLGATHRKIGTTYPLRPGVDLVLYARREGPAR